MNVKRSFWSVLMIAAVLGVVPLALQQAALALPRPSREAVAQGRGAAERAAVAEQVDKLKQALAEAEAEAQKGQQETEQGDVMNLDGDVNIDADETVKGDVVAVGGAAHVRGTVNGNVVAIDGDIHLYDGANVKGDVIAVGGTVNRESGAEVGGSKVQISAAWAERLAKMAHVEPAPGGLDVIGSDGEMVEFGKSVHIEPGEEVKGDLVVFGGSADVEGKVQGDVVVLGGPLDVEGYVRGNAVSIGGSVHLHSGARVRGDAVSIGGRVRKDAGVELGGDRVGLGQPFGLMPGGKHIASALLQRVAMWFVWGLGLLVVTLLVVLVLPRQTDVIATSIAEAPGRAAVYGLVGWLLVLPVLVILGVLVVTW
ncbi:MAG: hypothetical protein ACE5JM_16540, partial [Armatimonadota bacterium]